MIESIQSQGYNETIYLIRLEEEDVTYTFDEGFIYYRNIEELKDLHKELNKVIQDETSTDWKTEYKEDEEDTPGVR